jgi:HAD superfamily hydrolase (TIGR01459 family)
MYLRPPDCNPSSGPARSHADTAFLFGPARPKDRQEGDAMTRIIDRLAEIAPAYDALFCDLWGCVHDGIAPFPGAVAALQGYRRGGGRVILLTNAPRPRAAVERQLDRIGVPRDCWDAIATSGDASQTAMLLGAVGQRVWHIGPEKDHSFFTDIPADLPQALAIERVGLDEAEGIVCTGPFDELTETPEDYRGRLILARERGLKLLCTNPDLVVDMGDRRIYCAGAIAALYTELGGESLYFGKPHPPIYDLARRRLAEFGQVSDDRILCLGDGVLTDVAGGLAEGLDALFITEGLAAGEFGADPQRPDPALVEAYLARHQVTATAAIARLR